MTPVLFFLGLDMQAIKLVLEQLARLHASSYHMRRVFPGGEEEFQKEFEVIWFFNK